MYDMDDMLTSFISIIVVAGHNECLSLKQRIDHCYNVVILLFVCAHVMRAFY